jgi:hypothetical protein
MAKYKLINKTNNEQQFICEKVVMQGNDCYVTDNPEHGDYCLNNKTGEFFEVTDWHYVNGSNMSNDDKKAIATNDKSFTDLPHVIDESKNRFDQLKSTDENLFSMLDLLSFKTGFVESQDTHPYSKADLIEFCSWLVTAEQTSGIEDINSKTIDEIIDVWDKNHRIITLYYN